MEEAPFEFLTLEDILDIHEDQLHRHGGSAGMIDSTVVQSASEQPKLLWKLTNGDVADVAAAYLYYLAASQGFLDGNKRTGAASATEFLARNGYMLTCQWEELYEVTIQVATRSLDREKLADWFAEYLAPIV
jgi:death-on-curing protein